ncbi:YiiX/YebB-like N1pC/P60 family cysteine hydrolase [Robiginitomaculum antarcticum]|uniref:YiiX/YebB-like N1pC/P60 family cysteine hydrolase n=1 Tax=Robiginitomaculum antarcticum TaxID=437507 RepID=UPI000374D08E|nr:YiiX/YebB-like N1pC/P60 family cysteine hydrolase [Robiginitomaculum antarcticum]
MTLSDAIRTLQASYTGLPTPRDMSVLVADSHKAETRGYYDPVEDARLRETFARYLGIRSAIWQVIDAVRPHYIPFYKRRAQMAGDSMTAFAIAFCGAEIIVRTGEYLIDLARERDIVWRKLDEADLRYNLPRKRFTRLYRQLTSHWKMRGYYRARDYFDANREAVMAAVSQTDFAVVQEILESLNLPGASRGDHLRRYHRFVNFSLRRRSVSASRNVMFALFEGTGSDIAELKIPLVKNFGARKRVTPDILQAIQDTLRPGDIFITRHDDAMSNLFLPGFWPHGAFYIGTSEQRASRGIADVSDGAKHSGQGDIVILEAKKDGVLLRPLVETLAVDSFVVLRPNLTEAQIDTAITNGLSHAGKLYDFIFDFATSDRLVCTEVIYRAFHGVGDIRFDLVEKTGRKCLPAEDVMNQAISSGWFTPVLIFGVNNNRLTIGTKATDVLRHSFNAVF